MHKLVGVLGRQAEKETIQSVQSKVGLEERGVSNKEILIFRISASIKCMLYSMYSARVGVCVLLLYTIRK